LPDGAEAENAQAQFQEWNVAITIPLAQSKLKQIPIQASSLNAGARAQSGEQKPAASQTQPGQKAA